jgi:shikimate dehydrogenase
LANLGEFSLSPTISRPRAAGIRVVHSESLIEKCCLIANPAAGNPTQYLVEQAFERLGLDWRFMTFDVEPPQLGDAMRGIRALGIHGVKVGEPFQSAVLEHVDELTDAAKRAGSVNCITAAGDRLKGDNTEGAAIVSLVRKEVDPAGKRVMILGSGRMARVAAMELAEAGVTAITIASRNGTAGEELAAAIQRQSKATATFISLTGLVSIEPDTAALVNATSLGSTKPEAKMPINVASLSVQPVVVEVAYNTGRTWLSSQAAQQGCRVIDGVSVYVEQTALALQNWTGEMSDTAAMREAAEEFLGI